MNFTCIAFGVIFFIIGIVLSMGKIHVNLDAWKAMPEYEKKKIKIKPLCFNIGTAIAICGLIFFIGGIWKSFKDYLFIWIMLVWLVSVSIDVYYIGKSKRYRHK